MLVTFFILIISWSANDARIPRNIGFHFESNSPVHRRRSISSRNTADTRGLRYWWEGSNNPFAEAAECNPLSGDCSLHIKPNPSFGQFVPLEQHHQTRISAHQSRNPTAFQFLPQSAQSPRGVFSHPERLNVRAPFSSSAGQRPRFTPQIEHGSLSSFAPQTEHAAKSHFFPQSGRIAISPFLPQRGHGSRSPFSPESSIIAVSPLSPLSIHQQLPHSLQGGKPHDGTFSSSPEHSLPVVDQIPISAEEHGTMGQCLAGAICLNWQLCNDAGYVISDGTAKINDIKDIPNNYIDRFTRCGPKSFCCKIDLRPQAHRPPQRKAHPELSSSGFQKSNPNLGPQTEFIPSNKNSHSAFTPNGNSNFPIDEHNVSPQSQKTETIRDLPQGNQFQRPGKISNKNSHQQRPSHLLSHNINQEIPNPISPKHIQQQIPHDISHTNFQQPITQERDNERQRPQYTSPPRSQQISSNIEQGAPHHNTAVKTSPHEISHQEKNLGVPLNISPQSIQHVSPQNAQQQTVPERRPSRIKEDLQHQEHQQNKESVIFHDTHRQNNQPENTYPERLDDSLSHNLHQKTSKTNGDQIPHEISPQILEQEKPHKSPSQNIHKQRPNHDFHQVITPHSLPEQSINVNKPHLAHHISAQNKPFQHPHVDSLNNKNIVSFGEGHISPLNFEHGIKENYPNEKLNTHLDNRPQNNPVAQNSPGENYSSNKNDGPFLNEPTIVRPHEINEGNPIIAIGDNDDLEDGFLVLEPIDSQAHSKRTDQLLVIPQDRKVLVIPDSIQTPRLRADSHILKPASPNYKSTDFHETLVSKQNPQDTDKRPAVNKLPTHSTDIRTLRDPQIEDTPFTDSFHSIRNNPENILNAPHDGAVELSESIPVIAVGDKDDLEDGFLVLEEIDLQGHPESAGELVIIPKDSDALVVPDIIQPSHIRQDNTYLRKATPQHKSHNFNDNTNPSNLQREFPHTSQQSSLDTRKHPTEHKPLRKQHNSEPLRDQDSPFSDNYPSTIKNPENVINRPHNSQLDLIETIPTIAISKDDDLDDGFIVLEPTDSIGQPEAARELVIIPKDSDVLIIPDTIASPHVNQENPPHGSNGFNINNNNNESNLEQKINPTNKVHSQFIERRPEIDRSKTNPVSPHASIGHNLPSNGNNPEPFFNNLNDGPLALINPIISVDDDGDFLVLEPIDSGVHPTSSKRLVGTPENSNRLIAQNTLPSSQLGQNSHNLRPISHHPSTRTDQNVNKSNLERKLDSIPHNHHQSNIKHSIENRQHVSNDNRELRNSGRPHIPSNGKLFPNKNTPNHFLNNPNDEPLHFTDERPLITFSDKDDLSDGFVVLEPIDNSNREERPIPIEYKNPVNQRQQIQPNEQISHNQPYICPSLLNLKNQESSLRGSPNRRFEPQVPNSDYQSQSTNLHSLDNALKIDSQRQQSRINGLPKQQNVVAIPQMAPPIITPLGTELVGNVCSGGVYCVLREECNPFNGFIIMDQNQVAAVSPLQETVPLLSCFVPLRNQIQDGVCCQLPHPIPGTLDHII